MDELTSSNVDQELIERIKNGIEVFFSTQAEAEQAVQAFWEAMPHGQDILHVARRSGDWSQELTMGDRTTVRKAVGRGERTKGEWKVYFRGNGQALTDPAIDYLKCKGY